MNEIKAKNTLRVIAASTNDELIRDFALDLLNETLEQAKDKLKGTCWVDDSADMRGAIKRNLREYWVSLGKHGNKWKLTP